MKSLFIGDKPTVARLAERLKQAGSHAECLRIQWVPIRATLDGSAARISQAGGMLMVAEIQLACREQVGKAVAPPTVHRLLDRHGWRKVVPRPRHPKTDVAALAVVNHIGRSRSGAR